MGSLFLGPASQRGRKGGPTPVLLVTDPGPDPDDVKALLVLAILHKQREISFVGAICNGGGQPKKRAQLARCILDSVGERDIPVAHGSEGKPHSAKPYEYAIEGFDGVNINRLRSGPELMKTSLLASRDNDLTVVLISSLRDFADAIDQERDLVLQKVARVAIMGGLTRNESNDGWVPDTAVNNMFDMDAARAVYAFCFAQGLPMCVVSRHAVPVIEMQLARSFASHSTLLRYLADAQFLGLVGLWAQLCAGKLPERCSKEWYFKTFCGVNEDEFEERDLGGLDAEADIQPYLKGVLKPYDVVAVMTALPDSAAIFKDLAGSQVEVASENGGLVTHTLLLETTHAINSSLVVRILRDTYHEALLASGRVTPPVYDSGFNRLRGGLDVLERNEAKRDASRSSISAHLSKFSRSSTSRRTQLSAMPDLARDDDEGVISIRDCISFLDSAIDAARSDSLRVTHVSVGIGSLLMFGMSVAMIVDVIRLAVQHVDEGDSFVLTRVRAYCVVAEGAAILLLLGLHPSRAHRRFVSIATVAHMCIDAAGVYIFAGYGLLRLREPAFFKVEPLQPGEILPPLEQAVGIAFLCSSGACFVAIVAQLWSLLKKPRNTRLPLTVTWGALGMELTVWSVAFLLIVVNAEVTRYTDTIPDLHHFIMWFHAIVSFLYAAFILSPNSRRRGQSYVLMLVDANRSVKTRSSVVALAPLLGFGTANERSADFISREVQASLHGARLDGTAFRALRAGPREFSRPARGYHGAKRSRMFLAWLRRSRRIASTISPIEGSERGRDVTDFHDAVLAADLPDQSPPPPHKINQTSQHIASLTASMRRGPSVGWRERTEYSLHHRANVVIDAYIVHSDGDDAVRKTLALQKWSADVAAKNGGISPYVWVDTLCTDPSLSMVQLLAHLPFYMARSRRLVILAGPKILSRLWNCIELWCWHAMGGKTQDIVVLPISTTEAEHDDVVCSFDAFHVMHAAVPSNLEARESIIRAVELTPVMRFNEIVRGLLPAVKSVGWDSALTE